MLLFAATFCRADAAARLIARDAMLIADAAPITMLYFADADDA